MRVAVNLVKDGTAQACVSAGNTGALMAISRFVLKMLPGIDRPAIASQLPTRTGTTTVLDLGANVNCTPEQLVQFAVMGTALAAAVDGIERPTVGLLNIGEEDIKGNDVVKATAELLSVVGPQFLRQRRGQRHLQGNHRRRRLRRLRRQRHVEGFRGSCHDPLRIPQGRIYAQSVAQACRRDGLSRADGIQTAGRSAPAQRRDADRPHGRLSSRAMAAPTPWRSSTRLHKAYAEASHGVLDRIAQKMAAMPAARRRGARFGARLGSRRQRARCIAASSGPAATCRRTS